VKKTCLNREFRKKKWNSRNLSRNLSKNFDYI